MEQYQREVNRLDKEIVALQRKKSELDKKAADESSRASSVSFDGHLSESTVKSRMTEKERHEKAAIKASQDSAKVQKDIADKQEKRNTAYSRLQQEQQKEQKKEREQMQYNEFCRTQTDGGAMNILSKDCEVVLRCIIKMYEELGGLGITFDDEDVPKYFPAGYKMSIIVKIFRMLETAGMVYNVAPFIGGMSFQLSPSALDYFDEKEQMMREKDAANQLHINIGTFNAQGGNNNFGSMVNSSMNNENGWSALERKIEEEGGDDKEEMKEALNEIKQLCEAIRETRSIPKNSVMDKISGHLAKHGWFYSTVLQLIGVAVLNCK